MMGIPGRRPAPAASWLPLVAAAAAADFKKSRSLEKRDMMLEVKVDVCRGEAKDDDRSRPAAA